MLNLNDLLKQRAQCGGGYPVTKYEMVCGYLYSGCGYMLLTIIIVNNDF